MNRRWLLLGAVGVALIVAVIIGVQRRHRYEREVKALMLTPIEVGMAQADVQSALGPPTTVRSRGEFRPDDGCPTGTAAEQCWVYTRDSFNREIYFDAMGRVACVAAVMIEV
jgi:hypothetical protein